MMFIFFSKNFRKTLEFLSCNIRTLIYDMSIAKGGHNERHTRIKTRKELSW